MARKERLEASPDPLPIRGETLPPADLAVRLIAIPAMDEAGALRLSYAASIHAPGVEPPPPEGLPPEALPPILLRLRLAPHASRLPDGPIHLTYAATLAGPETSAAGPPPRPGASGGEADPSSGDETIRVAAEAVRSAAPADRFTRLLDLAGAVDAAGRLS